MNSSLILPLLLVVLALPLFLSARKQRRQMQEMQKLQNSLAPGDRVLTTSGLQATVAGVADDTIDLEVAPGMYTTWVRAAVREKIQPVTDDVEDVEDGDDDIVADDHAQVEEHAKADVSPSSAGHTGAEDKGKAESKAAGRDNPEDKGGSAH